MRRNSAASLELKQHDSSIPIMLHADPTPAFNSGQDQCIHMAICKGSVIRPRLAPMDVRAVGEMEAVVQLHARADSNPRRARQEVIKNFEIKPRPRVSGYNPRNAAEIGIRTARMAGNSPPIKPMPMASRIALTRSCGVTAKANAIWLKVCQLMVATVSFANHSKGSSTKSPG